MFFSMAGMGIGAALKTTNLAAIILRSLFKVAKNDCKRMIKAVIWLTSIISIFVSDGAAQITVLAVVASIVLALGDPEPGTNRLLGGIMLGITVGSFTGGMFLPCSNTANVAIMELAATVSGGKEMTFLQWGIFGIPSGFLLTLVASIVIPKFFNPEPISEIQIANVEKVFETIPKRLQPKDIYYLCITSVMLVLWIASNWVSLFDTATVAMIGMVFMMLPIPKLQLLTTKAYKANFGVMVVLTMLCMFPLARCMQSSGLGEWIVGKMFSNAANWSVLLIYISAAVCAFILHMLIPSGNACGVLATTLLGPIMVRAGIPVSAAIVCIGIQTGTSFLFPIEGTWQYTFGSGYYKFDDVTKSSWMVAVVGLLCGFVITPLFAIIFRSFI
jgi:di/tricarboxylate transporter